MVITSQTRMVTLHASAYRCTYRMPHGGYCNTRTGTVVATVNGAEVRCKLHVS